MSNSPLNDKPNTLRNDLISPNSKASHRPSVPISVYRELAAELEGTQAQLEDLYEKNQKLERYNKQLHQEIMMVLDSTHHLEQVMRVWDEGEGKGKKPQSQLPTTSANTPAMVSPQADAALLPPEAESTPESVKQRRSAVNKPQKQKSSQSADSLLLFMGIALLALTAFFTGYLVVRPMFTDDTPSQVN